MLKLIGNLVKIKLKQPRKLTCVLKLICEKEKVHIKA